MSNLNQAFIKAYQRRGIAGPHIPLASVTKAVSAAAAVAPADEIATDDAGESAARPSASAGVRAFDREANAVPPSHLFKKSPLATRPGPYAVDDVPPLESPAPPAAAAVKQAPATAALSERESNHLDAVSKFEADLEPAYEVERFEWPAVVTSLAGNADAELSALVNDLLPDGRGALCVTGCRRGEGRTTIALLTARHLARSGLRVLAVDADFQRPNLAACLATDAELGWAETFVGDEPQQAMIESLNDRLVILPLREAVEDAAQAAAAFRRMRDHLSAKFDVLCIDMGPFVDGRPEHAIDFGEARATAAIVVRDVRHSRMEQSQAVGRKLADCGVNRWAIIENFV